MVLELKLVKLLEISLGILGVFLIADIFDIEVQVKRIF